MPINDPLTVRTPAATACFVHVFEPRLSLTPGDEPKYSITLVFPKSADLNPLKAAAKAAVEKRWGNKPPTGLRSPFRDGDADRAGDPTFADTIFINANTKNRPGVVDQKRNLITDPMDFYSGCKCRATLYALAYDVNGNKGVKFCLNNLQKLSDGERLSGRRPAAADFDDAEYEQDPQEGSDFF